MLIMVSQSPRENRPLNKLSHCYFFTVLQPDITRLMNLIFLPKVLKNMVYGFAFQNILNMLRPLIFLLTTLISSVSVQTFNLVRNPWNSIFSLPLFVWGHIPLLLQKIIPSNIFYGDDNMLLK